MLDRPIVIIGSPRAGKSCVGKIICASPEFGYFNEPHAVWSWGQRRGSDDRRVAEDITDSLRRKIIGSCEQVLRESGLSRYVDDLATHSLRIPFIRAVIPDVRIIHVIRNGEQVIPEMLHGWTHGWDSVLRAAKKRRSQYRLRHFPLGATLVARGLWNQGLAKVRGHRSTWGPRVPGMSAFMHSHTIAEVSARLGVSQHSLYKWVNVVKPGQSEQQINELLEAKSEILKLRPQLRRTEEERDILKKAAVDSIGRCNTLI